MECEAQRMMEGMPARSPGVSIEQYAMDMWSWTQQVVLRHGTNQELMARVKQLIEERVEVTDEEREAYSSQSERRDLTPDEFVETFGIAGLNPTMKAARVMAGAGVDPETAVQRYLQVSRERGRHLAVAWDIGDERVCAYRWPGELEVRCWVYGELEEEPSTVFRAGDYN